MMQAFTFGKKIALGFGLSVLMLLLVSGVAYRTTDTLIENDHQVTHTHAVLESLAHLLSLMKDAETGQRGFLITGAAAYLEPYEKAVASLPAQLERLRRVTVDRRLSRRKPAELKATIAARQSRGPTAAARIVATGEGKALMDQIRAVVDAMRALDSTPPTHMIRQAAASRLRRLESRPDQ